MLISQFCLPHHIWNVGQQYMTEIYCLIMFLYYVLIDKINTEASVRLHSSAIYRFFLWNIVCDVVIGSGKGLAQCQFQAVSWTNADNMRAYVSDEMNIVTWDAYQGPIPYYPSWNHACNLFVNIVYMLIVVISVIFYVSIMLVGACGL